MKFRAYTYFTKLSNKFFSAILTHTDCSFFSTQIILKRQHCSVRHLLFPCFLSMDGCLGLYPNGDDHNTFFLSLILWKKENSNGTFKKIFSQLMRYFRSRRTILYEFLTHGQNPLFLSCMPDLTFTLELVLL